MVREGNPRPLPNLRRLGFLPSVPHLNERAPPRLTLGPDASLVALADCLRLHAPDPLLVNVTGSAREPDRPISAWVPVNAAWGRVLLPRTPVPSCCSPRLLWFHRSPPTCGCAALEGREETPHVDPERLGQLLQHRHRGAHLVVLNPHDGHVADPSPPRQLPDRVAPLVTPVTEEDWHIRSGIT